MSDDLSNLINEVAHLICQIGADGECKIHHQDASGTRVCPAGYDQAAPLVDLAAHHAWNEGAEADYEWQIGVTGRPTNPYDCAGML